MPPLNKKSDRVNGVKNIGVFSVWRQDHCRTLRSQFM